MSACRNICATGWRRDPRPKAISSSRSTSIRRAFCDPTTKPAAICDGRPLLAAPKNPRPLRDATLTRSVQGKPRVISALGDDLGGDAADAGTGQADGARCAGREVEDTPLDEGT